MVRLLVVVLDNRPLTRLVRLVLPDKKEPSSVHPRVGADCLAVDQLECGATAK
jgi:hypothetical protein